MAELADAPDLGSGVPDVKVQVLSGAPNKNLKVDRNLEVFALYFGSKETFCLCGFQNTSCKSDAMR